MIAQLLLSPPHVIGHTFQHLEAEAVLRGLIHFAQQIGVGDGEEVMRSHSYVQHTRILGFQTSFYDVKIVGIHLRLVGTNRIGPSAQVADDVLHIQVAPLHNTHLDGRATFLHTLAGKLQQFTLETFGIRQISLHHDTCLIVLELRQGQHILEQFHGQVGIFVLLHIQIDELGLGHSVHIGIRIVDSRLIEFRHSSNQFREAFLVV